MRANLKKRGYADAHISLDGEVVTDSLLDKPLAQMCDKAHLLNLMRNFVVFDANQKTLLFRHHYECVKAAQERVKKHDGGVIWHIQGSGKSILMVLIAKWLLEYAPETRILVITDRDELDKQTTRDVFDTYYPHLQVRPSRGRQGGAGPKYEAHSVPPQLTSKKAVDAWLRPRPRV